MKGGNRKLGAIATPALGISGLWLTLRRLLSTFSSRVPVASGRTRLCARRLLVELRLHEALEVALRR